MSTWLGPCDSHGQAEMLLKTHLPPPLCAPATEDLPFFPSPISRFLPFFPFFLLLYFLPSFPFSFIHSFIYSVIINRAPIMRQELY